MYHSFRQLWLVLGVKLMEINSNWFSRYIEIYLAILRFRDLFGMVSENVTFPKVK